MINTQHNIYPSLLIITRRNVLIDTDSTSVTIRSFLGSWPEDKLSIICCEDFNAGENGRLSSNCYQMTNSDVKFGSFLFKTNNRKSSSAVGNPVVIVNKNPIVRFKSWLKHIGYLIYTCLPYKKTEELDSFIKERNPVVIYTNCTNYRMLKLVNSVAQKYQLSIIPHFFDDWPNVYMEKGSFGYRGFNRELNLLFNHSPVTLCISPKMCEEYSNRYHIEKTYPLLNSVEYKPLKKSNTIKEEFILFYAGSLYLGRQESLLALCECISHNKKNIHLQICAPKAQWKQFSSLFDSFPFVEYCGFLSGDEISIKMANSECLLFVESFDDKYLRYTSLSLSTRLPEYLSTGIPIFALGNKQQGSLEYLSENGAAYVAFNKEDIMMCLEKCINHTDDKTLLSSSKKLFMENHLRSHQEKRFYEIIKSIVQ